MTVASLFSDLTLLSVFLMCGFILRQWVKPLRTYFVPAAVIGGVIALISGPQVLGLVEIPESFSSMSSVLINVITTAPILGAVIDRNKVRTYADYTVLACTTYGAQLAVGVGLGALLQKVWPALPEGWGIMAVFSFWGGHGTASAAGTVFENAGIENNTAIGMILSTIGLVCAIVIGMVIVNWGVRKGYAEHVSAQRGDLEDNSGVIPKEKRNMIGEERVSSSGVNNLAFQAAILMCCIFLGTFLMKYVKQFVPITKDFPPMINGIIGALIIWPLMKASKKDEYLDRRTINNIAGLCLEIVIVAAIATLKLSVLGSFIVPILLMSLVCLGVTLVICMWLPRKISRESWFEKCVTQFGQASGAVPTGLALLRCVDPHNETSVTDSVGVQNSLMSPFYTVMSAVGPMILLANIFHAIGLGAALFVGSLVVARLFLWNKRTSPEARS